MLPFGGWRGAQRKLWIDHVSATPVWEGNVPPPVCSTEEIKYLFQTINTSIRRP